MDPAVIINLTRKREEGIGEEGIRGGRIGDGERGRGIREGFGFAVFRRFSPYCILTFRSEGTVAKTHQFLVLFVLLCSGYTNPIYELRKTLKAHDFPALKPAVLRLPNSDHSAFHY